MSSASPLYWAYAAPILFASSRLASGSFTECLSKRLWMRPSLSAVKSTRMSGRSSASGGAAAFAGPPGAQREHSFDCVPSSGRVHDAQRGFFRSAGVLSDWTACADD